jgi:hypothetical protein
MFSQPWDVTPYSPLKVNRSFGGTYRLHCYLLLADFLLGLFFDHEDGCDMLLRTTRRYIPEDVTPHFDVC